MPMPLIIVHLPVDSFNRQQKQQFAEQATNTLLALEGMAEHPKAQNLSWVQYNEFNQENFYMAGHSVAKPHYRIEVKVFQGTMNGDKKEKLTKRLTELLLAIEATDHNLLNAARVWVMIEEVPDGNWGGAGKIYRIKDLMKLMF